MKIDSIEKASKKLNEYKKTLKIFRQALGITDPNFRPISADIVDDKLVVRSSSTSKELKIDRIYVQISFGQRQIVNYSKLEFGLEWIKEIIGKLDSLESEIESL